MISFPNAKINLGLHVLNRRNDGFHNIDTVFCPIGWNDTLEIIPSVIDSSEAFQINIKGMESLNPKDNLCYKAYDLLSKDFKLPSMICYLQKSIPAGAGLGGGSSDAAAALKIISSIASLNLDDEQLQSYASKLGSDCAFFIENKPVRATGKGDKFYPVTLSLSKYFFVVVMPQFSMNTAEAYNMIKPAMPELPLESLIMLPVNQWKYVLANDFENAVFDKYPELKLIKEELYKNNAVYASMSGSGTAIYGIFEKETDLHRVFKGCKVWSGKA